MQRQAAQRNRPTYRQVGVIRAAHKGCKSGNLPEAQNGLRAASLGIPADPTLGSMFLACFSTNLQRKIDLTNAFKSIFRDDSLQPCSEIAGFVGKQGLGLLGGARARAPTRVRSSRPQGLEFAADLKRAVDKVQRQESCPGPGGPYRHNLTVSDKPTENQC